MTMTRSSSLSLILFATIAAMITAVTLSMNQIPDHVSAQNNSSIASTTTTQPSTMVKVQAGGGNTTLPFSVFNPKQVEIKNGESISWYNPSKVGEPHTVTFAFDNNTRPGLSTPFVVKNSSSFIAIPHGSNSEPVILPNPQNPSMTMILASNARASNPVVLDSAGNVTHLKPDATYTVKGTEKYINSGLLFPKGKGPPNGITSFTLTFEKAGVYNYYCILHPWMKGKVVVK